MTDEAQESRRDTVTAAVTSQEKWYVQLVARREGRDISNLLREFSLAALIERGRRLNEALERVG